MSKTRTFPLAIWLSTLLLVCLQTRGYADPAKTWILHEQAKAALSQYSPNVWVFHRAGTDEAFLWEGLINGYYIPGPKNVLYIHSHGAGNMARIGAGDAGLGATYVVRVLTEHGVEFSKYDGVLLGGCHCGANGFGAELAKLTGLPVVAAKNSVQNVSHFDSSLPAGQQVVAKTPFLVTTGQIAQSREELLQNPNPWVTIVPPESGETGALKMNSTIRGLGEALNRIQQLALETGRYPSVESCEKFLLSVKPEPNFPLD